MFSCVATILCCRKRQRRETYERNLSYESSEYGIVLRNRPRVRRRGNMLRGTMPIFTSSLNSDNSLFDVSSVSSISSLNSIVFFSDETSLRSSHISQPRYDEEHICRSTYDQSLFDNYKSKRLWDTIFNLNISSDSSSSFQRHNLPTPVEYPPEKAFYINKGGLANSCDVNSACDGCDNEIAYDSKIINSLQFMDAFRNWTIAHANSSSDYTDYIINSATIGSELYNEFLESYILANSRFIDSINSDIDISGDDDSSMYSFEFGSGYISSIRCSSDYSTSSTSLLRNSKSRNLSSTDSQVIPSNTNGGNEVDIVIESSSLLVQNEDESRSVGDGGYGGVMVDGTLMEKPFPCTASLLWNGMKNIANISSYIINFDH